MGTSVSNNGPFDVILRGGRIVDGSGAPWYSADIGIANGKIARIGQIPAETPTERTIDADGRYVAPGFIDMMGQFATPMLRDPRSAMNLLTQGITSIHAGEGYSAAPLDEQVGRREGWRTMAEYLDLLDGQGLPVNVAQNIGLTSVRQIVLGDHDREATEAELRDMAALVEEAMQAGATGLSTALIYPPATFSSQAEITAMCRVVARYGGKYYTHIRNEGDTFLEALDEALAIGRDAEVPVHIFHLKAAGRQNWGKMDAVIGRIRQARSSGQQVTADVYPYINNGLYLTAFVHSRHFARGMQAFLESIDFADVQSAIRRELEETTGWENWYRHVGHRWDRVIIGRTTDPEYRESAGLSISEMALRTERDPWQIFFQLLKADTFALPQSMSEANLIKVVRQEFVTYCTDVGPAGDFGLAAHPRAAGAFPRLLARYVRDLGTISLERFVAQASASAANEIMAYERGRLAVGLAADMIVFDLDAVADHATFGQPQALASGMEAVIVNGRIVLENGEFTGQLPGHVLRRGRLG